MVDHPRCTELTSPGEKSGRNPGTLPAIRGGVR